jgi:hypothetical protein
VKNVPGYGIGGSEIWFFDPAVWNLESGIAAAGRSALQGRTFLFF